MRLVKVEIENFQSIKKLTLDLGQFTVLVGASDQGKTAIIRAIESVFTNPAGQSRVRKGASLCTVRLDFDDGSWVLWEKGKTSRYVVNMGAGPPVAYNKMGRTTPPELAQIIKMWEVEGGKPVCVQIQRQFDPPFLIGESRAHLARTLDELDGKVYRGALTACQSSTRTMKRKQSELERDEEHWKERTDFLSEVDGLAASSSLAEQRMQTSTGMLKHVLLGQLPNLSRVDALFRWLLLSKMPLAPSVAVIGSLCDWLAWREQERQAASDLAEVESESKSVEKLLFASGYCPLCKRKMQGVPVEH